MKRVRARAPLRLGLAGGGTDLSPYCDEHGGCVLNLTIGLYAYAFIQESTSWTARFTANDMDVIDETMPMPELRLDEPDCLRLHRGVYNRIVKDLHGGRPLALTVSSVVQAPPGSGLGSSSALVVALVKAFTEYLNMPLGDYEIARLAYDIERVDLGLSGGRQDQYASAFGGCNFIEFLADDRVIVNPLRIHEAHRLELDSSLVICHTGRSRESANIINQQTDGLRSRDPASLAAMHNIKADAVEMKLRLLRGDVNGMADVMRRSWEAKKQTASKVTTSEINRIYEMALSNGALAGKISGAGGGGFLMLLTEPESRSRLAKALRDINVEVVPFHFVEGGRVMDIGSLMRPATYVRESIAVLEKLLDDRGLLEQINHLGKLSSDAIRSGGKILFAGNGGSAADAQHLAGELVSRFLYDRPGIASIALTTDTSVLTAIGNDYGYEKLFSRQIEALGREGDVFIGISTSGRSPNVVNGLMTARRRGLTTVGLTGQSGGDMLDLCDLVIRVPSDSTPIIQQAHLVIGHLLCGMIEEAIYPKA